MKTDHFGDNLRKLEIMKAFDVNLRNMNLVYDLPRLEYPKKNHYDEPDGNEDANELQFIESVKKIEKYIESVPEKEDFHEKIKMQAQSFHVTQFNLHGEDTTMLFRHFIDAFIRVAYLREDCKVDEIGLGFERLMLDNIKPILIDKIEVINIYAEEEQKAAIYIDSKMNDPIVTELFDNNLFISNLGIPNHMDKTTN